MSETRDRCAVVALQMALRHLGPPLSIAEAGGNIRLTPKGQDIEYIRMTLDLYDGLCDENGDVMVRARADEIDNLVETN